LTAAGKTTHALLLARDLGYRYVSATQMMAELAGIPADQVDERFWLTFGDQIAELRKQPDLDLELDRRLIQLATERDDLVVDAWAAPWLLPRESAVAVWLGSTHETRSMKASVSDEGRETVSWYSDFIAEKDRTTRRYFLDLYDFDLFDTPGGSFDLVIDNSAHIRVPTREDSDRGIAEFHPTFRHAIQALFPVRPHQPI
jgi:cytidylate kinase